MEGHGEGEDQIARVRCRLDVEEEDVGDIAQWNDQQLRKL